MNIQLTKNQFYRGGGFSNPRFFRTSHNVYDNNGNVIACVWKYWERRG